MTFTAIRDAKSGLLFRGVLVALQNRETRRTQIQAELAHLNAITDTPFDADWVEAELRSYLKDWSGLPQRHPAQTRQILRKLLPEKQRIRVWHEGCGRYRFAGEAALGRVFRGFVEGKYFGVPNRNVNLSMSHLAHLIIPFSGEITLAA